MRRAQFIVGWALLGALLWAVIFGGSLLLGADEPEDFLEQATFLTEKVEAVAGGALKDGPCSESKDSFGSIQTHGTSYQVDIAWTGSDGSKHTGEMSTCDPPSVGEQLTVWVSSRDMVFNRSPLDMYSSVPIAAVLFAAGAWAWTWLKKDERRGSGRRSRARGSANLGPRARRKRLRELRAARQQRLGKPD